MIAIHAFNVHKKKKKTIKNTHNKSAKNFMKWRKTIKCLMHRKLYTLLIIIMINQVLLKGSILNTIYLLIFKPYEYIKLSLSFCFII